MGFVESISSWLLFFALVITVALLAINSYDIFKYTDTVTQKERDDEFIIDPAYASYLVGVLCSVLIILFIILVYIFIKNNKDHKLPSMKELITLSIKFRKDENGNILDRFGFQTTIAWIFCFLYFLTLVATMMCEFLALESFDLIMENEQKFIESGVMQNQEAYNAFLEKYTTINRLYSGVIIIAVISLIPIFGGIINVFSKEKKIITPVKGK